MGKAVKLKAGRDRDRNGRGRLRIFFIYARADTKTSKVSGGKGRSLRVLFGRRSFRTLCESLANIVPVTRTFDCFDIVAAFATLRTTWLSLFAKLTPVLYSVPELLSFLSFKNTWTDTNDCLGFILPLQSLNCSRY